MGLFDFLFGRNRLTRVEVEPLRIWVSVEEKYAGIVDEIEAWISVGVEVIVVLAHFEDVLRDLRDRIPEFPQATVSLLSSSEFDANLANTLRIDETTSLGLIVAERHPLLSVDDHLVEVAEMLPCRSRLSPHLSMEDAVLRLFGGDEMRAMMSRLGIEQGEPLQSQMLARRVQGAQKKIEQQAYGNAPAKSAEEWLEINHP